MMYFIICHLLFSVAIYFILSLMEENAPVLNAFAIENLQCMKYVEFCGAFWKINSVDIQMPRLILRIGGAWNGETATT